ncbi:hypothetical protein [Aliivibrio kagoshimensis]|uniref:hypothetical protein n=1 Tax=Aliivibrio kagoshimensis TaxID=2910230 RepID=UPI003D0A3179
MDISVWLKLPTVILTFILVSKHLYDWAKGKTFRLREDYDFAKSFLTDVQDGQLHPYAVEKGYQALAGTPFISVKEIEYILTLENSVKCLSDYVLATDYLEKLETEGSLQLKFKDKYASNGVRTRRKLWYVGWYLTFSMIAFSPLFMSKVIDITFLQSLYLFVITFLYFGTLALLSAKAAVRIIRGENLVKNQSEYLSRKIVHS